MFFAKETFGKMSTSSEILWAQLQVSEIALMGKGVLGGRGFGWEFYQYPVSQKSNFYRQ